MEKLGDTRIYTPPQIVGVASNVNIEGHEILREAGMEARTIRNGLTGKSLSGQLENVDAVITRTGLEFDRTVLEGSSLAAIIGACKNPTVDKDALMQLGIAGLKCDNNTKWVVRAVISKIMSEATGEGRGVLATRESHDWPKSRVAETIFDPEGKTLGIIGFGMIGQELARQAKALGLKVVAFNNKSTERRDYEARMETIARHEQVDLIIGDEEDRRRLLDEADILTIHTGPTNHLGESNKDLLTEDDIRRFASSGLGIVINLDRDFLLPEVEVMQEMVRDGVLRAYLGDVFRPELEGPGYSYPVDRELHGLRITPHIGGSGSELAIRTAQSAANKLVRWAQKGEIIDDSLTHPRVTLAPSDVRASDILMAVHSSTRDGILAEMGAVISSTGLGVPGVPASLNDRVAGENITYGFVPRLYTIKPNGREYPDVVRDLAIGMSEIPDAGVRSVRFLPQNPEQAEALRTIRFNPNHTEV